MGFIARFFLLVLILSFGELYFLILVANEISLLLTLALCVLTGVIGGGMVRHQGLNTLKNIQKTMGKGSVPGVDIVSGLILLVIGTLLLTPGFITDTIAFILLVPPIRKLAAARLLNHFKKRVTMVNMSSFTNVNQQQARPRRPEDVIIDVDPE